MSYEYDVFLSYTNSYPFGQWVREHFLGLFSAYLNEALASTLKRESQIFIDTEGIQAGDDYPARLKQKLARSRCLVAIWSPKYFYVSKWCQYECNVMIYREQQLGYRTHENPSGLIFPFVVHDGEYFPDFAKRIQSFDCKKYARIGPGFKKTKNYTKFQRSMIKWTGEIAEAMNNVPEWIADMETEAWLNNPLNQSIIKEPDFPVPTLE